MKKIKAQYFLSLFLLLGIMTATVVLAAPVTIDDPLELGNDAVNTLATRLITAALGVSGVLALLSFIYGGIMYLLAGVNPEYVKKGKEAMKWAVIGLLVIFTSYAVINFILTEVFGIK
jgi:branched-subunit amino acid transport protein AzlD